MILTTDLDFKVFSSCTTVDYSDFLSDPKKTDFPLMDKPNVYFKLEPMKSNHSMVVLVLSAPNNIKHRNKLRKAVKSANNGKSF